MRKQIAAANWKMNLNFNEANTLLDELITANISLNENQLCLLAVPFPYLSMASEKLKNKKGYGIAAQNCHHKKNGAFTGEVSIDMLQSMQINYCLVGHSERREYNHETNEQLAQKLDLCFASGITPVFCCGEPLDIREAGTQNNFVTKQLEESLFHLPADSISKLIIAYEPIWAIGTGKTASTAQAQEIHQYLRSVIKDQYGEAVSSQVPILYGGSVKASNAVELFSCPDVDGGLVGGASLIAAEFIEIIRALK
jgi:triosephosphate isomerase (TIM)